MPELPEVETVVRGLNRQLIGRRIDAVQVFKPLVLKANPKTFSATLVGQTVDKISRHGKSIFWTLANGAHVKIHLGMTGALLFRAKEHAEDPYVRVKFQLDDVKQDLVYRDVRQFGKLSLSRDPFEKNWGPDAWDSSNNKLFDALRKKKGMIKHALMNQNVIAGLGNIYVDETLFLSRLHPKKRLEKLSDKVVMTVVDSARAVLAKSLDAGGTTFRDYVNTAGRRGEFKIQLNVYGQDSKPCRVCKTPIKKIVVASRGTHFCPRCQKR